MTNVLGSLPRIEDQHAFNQRRWSKVLDDPQLALLEHKIETNRFGNVIMMPPPGLGHSSLQGRIMELLREGMKESSGRVLPECPLSTNEGVKGIDVVWISLQRLSENQDENILLKSPEICIEVISPGNTRDELQNKKRLYFDGGAEEVWLCDSGGRMSFYLAGDPEEARGASELCESFPELVLD